MQVLLTIFPGIEGGILMAKASKDENDLKNPLDFLRLTLGIKA